MERRKLLGLLGGSVSLGLAGCLGGDGDGGDNNTNSSDNGGDGGNGGDNGNDNGQEPEPANLAVTITSSTDSVQAGESVTVGWEVENTGGMEGTQTVAFSVGGSEEDSEEVTVASGETATGEFSYTASAEDSGTLAVTVATDDGEDSATIDILAEAFFAVDITTPGPIRIETGGEATVPWAVENTGDLEGSQTVVFTVDGSQEGSEDVTLGGGETVTGEFSYAAGDDSEEPIETAVASDDETAEIIVQPGVAVVSNFSAAAESARAAIDNEPDQYADPGPELFQDIETGDPLVELSGSIFNDGNWESEEFNVPDLTDILVGADIGELLAGLIEDFDLQADLVDAFTLDELILEIAGVIEQFTFTQDQAQAVVDLIQILLDNSDAGLPGGLVASILKGVLIHPENRDENTSGDPVETIATDITELIEQISGLIEDIPTVEEVEDLLVAVTNFIDEIPNGETGQVLPYLAEVVRGFDVEGLLGDASIDAQPASVSGTAEPSGDGSGLLMTVPLTTVTLTADLGEGFSSELPAVDLDLGLELTTGESGNLTGEFTPNTDSDSATATVVDNQFTADLAEFDLAGLVEGLGTSELANLLAELFGTFDIDLREAATSTFDRYDSLEDWVELLDPVTVIENGDLLGLLERLFTDESGRHAVAADLGLDFDDLGAVLESA